MPPRLCIVAALSVAVGAGCGGADEELLLALDAEANPMGSLQARVRLGVEAEQPFVADEALALRIPADEGGEIVIQATDREERRSLALVIDLAYADVPGTVDLSGHVAVYTEVDASGRPVLVLDDVPTGTVDLVGDLSPGGEISGSFQFTLPEHDGTAAPLVGAFEGAFVAPVLTRRP